MYGSGVTIVKGATISVPATPAVLPYAQKFGQITVKSAAPLLRNAQGYVVIPAGSIVIGRDGKENRILGQCLLDTVSGHGMLCPGGYVLF